MTFAMSPGYTNETENGGRRAGSLPGSASACEAITSFAFESRSARLLLAQALHNRAAPWSWLPLRTRTRCSPPAAQDNRIHPRTRECRNEAARVRVETPPAPLATDTAKAALRPRAMQHSGGAVTARSTVRAHDSITEGLMV